MNAKQVVEKLESVIAAYQGDTGPVTWKAEDQEDKVLLIGTHDANSVGDDADPDEIWSRYGGDAILSAAGLDFFSSGTDAYQDHYGKDVVAHWVSISCDDQWVESATDAFVNERPTPVLFLAIAIMRANENNKTDLESAWADQNPQRIMSALTGCLRDAADGWADLARTFERTSPDDSVSWKQIFSAARADVSACVSYAPAPDVLDYLEHMRSFP